MIRINNIQKNRLKMLMKNTLYYRFSQKRYCNRKLTDFFKKYLVLLVQLNVPIVIQTLHKVKKKIPSFNNLVK